MQFDRVQMVFQNPVKVQEGIAPIRRFEPVTVDLKPVGSSLNGTGYTLYKGAVTFRDMFPERGMLDIVASGPKGRAEDKGTIWSGFQTCDILSGDLVLPPGVTPIFGD